MANNLEVSIDIDAPIEKVWAAVSDLTRMPQWSPQVRKVFQRGSGDVGTKTININRERWKIWPTRSEVIAFEPGRKIEWKVLDNGTRWSFTLAPNADGGTHVTERRTVPPGGTTKVSQMLVDRFLGGNEQFEASLTEGMNHTLQRLKTSLEH